MSKSVYFEFGYAQTNESLTFQFDGFAPITYTCVFNNAGPYQYTVNFGSWPTAGPQVAAEILSRMQTDIGANYTIERQGRMLRISKKDNADLASASVTKGSNPYFNVITNPELVWDFNDLSIDSIQVNLNQVTVNALGTNRPIQFKLGAGSWVAGDTDLQKFFSNVAPGQHTITVKDPFREVFATVNVLNMQATYVKNDPSMFGASDGSIDVSVFLGNPPYQYVWDDDGPFTQDRQNLQAGNYRVTISDSSGDLRVLEIALANQGEPSYSVQLLGVAIAAGTIELELKISINDVHEFYTLDGNYRELGGVLSGFGAKNFIEGFNQDNYLQNGFDQIVKLSFSDWANKFDPANPDRPFQFQFLINKHIADGQISFTSAIMTWYFVATNTGYKAWATLEQYRADTGLITGLIKPNDPDDPDYVPPVFDTNSCPLP
jgi:hypothetical protein